MVGSFLLLSLLAFVSYPKPSEIISLYVCGLGILFLLLVGIKQIEKNRAPNKDKMSKALEYILGALLAVYALVFLDVFAVSWFENRIVWNIFHTERGKVYMAINAVALIAVLLYCGAFRVKHARWPNLKDLGV